MSDLQDKTTIQSHAWVNAGFDLVSMRIILAAAIEQSFAGAAEREFTSLSAVSRRVNELEQRIGIILFDRHERGVSLTEAGSRFVAQLHEVFDRLEKIAVELEEMRTGKRGIVRISAPMTPSSGKLPDRVMGFLKEHPGIEVQIIEGTATAGIHGVSVGEIDLALVPETSETPNLTFIPFFEDKLVVLLPPEHSLVSRSALRLADLVAEPIIGIQRDSGLSTLYRQQMRAIGEKLKERAQTTSFESVRRMVSVGLGIAIVPETAARPYLEDHKFVIRPLDEEWASRPLVMCARTQERRSVATETFISWLIDDRHR